VVLTYKLLVFTTNYGISIWYHTTRNKTLMYPTHYPEMIMSVNHSISMPHINEPVQVNIYTNTMTSHELHSEIIKTAFIQAVLLI